MPLIPPNEWGCSVFQKCLIRSVSESFLMSSSARLHFFQVESARWFSSVYMQLVVEWLQGTRWGSLPSWDGQAGKKRRCPHKTGLRRGKGSLCSRNTNRHCDKSSGWGMEAGNWTWKQARAWSWTWPNRAKPCWSIKTSLRSPSSCRKRVET